jgi:hypothetical protein
MQIENDCNGTDKLNNRDVDFKKMKSDGDIFDFTEISRDKGFLLPVFIHRNLLNEVNNSTVISEILECGHKSIIVAMKSGGAKNHSFTFTFNENIKVKISIIPDEEGKPVLTFSTIESEH